MLITICVATGERIGSLSYGTRVKSSIGLKVGTYGVGSGSKGL